MKTCVPIKKAKYSDYRTAMNDEIFLFSFLRIKVNWVRTDYLISLICLQLRKLKTRRIV